MLVQVVNYKDICRDDCIGNYIDIYTGDYIDICRAICKAVEPFIEIIVRD